MRARATFVAFVPALLVFAVTSAARAQDDGGAAFSDASISTWPDNHQTANGGWSTTITRHTPRLTVPPREVRVPKPSAALRPASHSHAGAVTGTRQTKIHALTGIASFYWQGQMTASGEPFNKADMTAAHPSLPFGTKVRVLCAQTGRQVVVRINDRGPFKPGRIIDLSEAAADAIGMRGRGLTLVQLEVMRH